MLCFAKKKGKREKKNRQISDPLRCFAFFFFLFLFVCLFLLHFSEIRPLGGFNIKKTPQFDHTNLLTKIVTFPPSSIHLTNLFFTFYGIVHTDYNPSHNTITPFPSFLGLKEVSSWPGSQWERIAKISPQNINYTLYAQKKVCILPQRKNCHPYRTWRSHTMGMKVKTP